MKNILSMMLSGLLGILLGGCAGEIETYRFAKAGNDAYQAAEYVTALEYWQAGLEQARQVDHKPDISLFLYNVGLAYDKLSRYQEALDTYQQALPIARELNDQQREGNILINIGVVYQSQGQYQAALDAYRQALELKRAAADRAGEASVLNNIGAVYWHLGQFQEALTHYQQALQIRRDANDKMGEGSALNNIAGVYESQGQYQEALDAYQQALTLRRAIGDQSGAAGTLNNIGVVYWYLGQYQTALDYYRQALTIREETGDQRGAGYNLNNIGVVYWKTGEYEQALAYYQQALDIRRAIGDQRGEGSTLNNLGKTYESQQDYPQALSHYQQALTIRRTIGDQRGEGVTLTNLGEIYRQMAHYQEACAAFEISITINERLGTLDTLWMAQRGLAAVEVQLQQPEAALVHYEQALHNIETLRAGLSDDEYKLSFMQDKLYVYDEFIELLRALHETYPDKGYDRKALEIFERKQGRVFLEEIGKSGARLFAGLPEAIKQREEQLDLQLDQLRQQLAEARAAAVQDLAHIQYLEEHKRALHAEQNSLRATMQTDYPDYYALRYPQPATLAELQHTVLRPGELLFIYNAMLAHTLLWVISPEAFQMSTLPIGEQALYKQVAELRKIMQAEWNRSRGLYIPGQVEPTERQHLVYEQASRALYTLLIPENVRSLLTSTPAFPKSLNIVPTGPLYALPFEALVTGAGGEVHYLIEDLPISYLSSASLLKTLREAQVRRTTTARYPVLAFAHPAYTLDAPQNPGTVRSLRSDAYRELLGGGIPELPETAEEAQTVAAVLKAPNESEPVHLRQKASRANVFTLNSLKRLTDYQYLLFAMHGVLPEEVDRLRQSALILSDNFLTTSDVFGLHLNARLVVLSACNTGMGTHVYGEGILGLTRAFMYAGTPAIAVTLWSVESLSAKTLSIGIFRHLNEGYPPAQAVQAIKIQMLRGAEGQDYRRPYYWAPFVVFGDGGR